MDIGRMVRRRVRDAVEQARSNGSESTGSDDVNIVAAVNVAQSDTTTHASSSQHVDIVQNGRHTRITRKTDTDQGAN
ncbi:MAG: hypothetical protein QOI20_2586 [Acidimicrobiaceae bacterium]|jgi:hypothetical protein|nr:hypothetical protein [Acidimicrobiaceae bacterium]